MRRDNDELAGIELIEENRHQVISYEKKRRNKLYARGKFKTVAPGYKSMLGASEMLFG